jgi:hypothetical protein
MSALAFLPPSLRRAVQLREHAENRDEWISRAAEHIEADANKVRELVEDNIDAIDSPICSDSYTVPLLIALRELTPMFKRLCHGETLEKATTTPDEAQHFRALLRFADSSDAWIAKLIRTAAAEEVDAEGEE